MKTLKITEKTHQELTTIQADYYQITNVKLTFNEIIMALITGYQIAQNVKKQYHFNDGEHK